MHKATPPPDIPFWSHRFGSKRPTRDGSRLALGYCQADPSWRPRTSAVRDKAVQEKRSGLEPGCGLTLNFLPLMLKTKKTKTWMCLKAPALSARVDLQQAATDPNHRRLQRFVLRVKKGLKAQIKLWERIFKSHQVFSEREINWTSYLLLLLIIIIYIFIIIIIITRTRTRRESWKRSNSWNQNKNLQLPVDPSTSWKSTLRPPLVYIRSRSGLKRGWRN